MNIFVTSNCPLKSAVDLCDSHIVKMPIEYAQLLTSAILMYKDLLPPESVQINDGKLSIKGMYLESHKNNPLVLWTAQNQTNFKWLIASGIECCNEYSRRYKKSHKSLTVLKKAIEFLKYLPQGDLTEFHFAGIDEIKDLKLETIEAYRLLIAYKHLTKIRVHPTRTKRIQYIKWEKGTPPEWLDEFIAKCYEYGLVKKAVKK